MKYIKHEFKILSLQHQDLLHKHFYFSLQVEHKSHQCCDMEVWSDWLSELHAVYVKDYDLTNFMLSILADRK
jgi:hypothetical protein